MTTARPAAVNRVARYLPAKPEKVHHPALDLPAGPEARAAAWADALFDAVLALRAQLRHPDAAVVRAVATALLDLEKTRMRHAQPLSGAHVPKPAYDSGLPPLADCLDFGPAADDDEAEDEDVEDVDREEVLERLARKLKVESDAVAAEIGRAPKSLDQARAHYRRRIAAVGWDRFLAELNEPTDLPPTRPISPGATMPA